MSSSELLKRFLVLINPVAANRTTLIKYEEQVKPFLQRADSFVEFSILVTTGKGHAFEIGHKSDFG